MQATPSTKQTATVEQPYTNGEFKVSWSRSGKKSTSTLQEKHFQKSDDFKNLKDGVTISFELTPNKRNILDKSAAINATPESKRGSQGFPFSTTFSSPIQHKDEYWQCPDCEEKGNIWSNQTLIDMQECLSCNKKRPNNKNVGYGSQTFFWKQKQTNDGILHTLTVRKWKCTNCNFMNSCFAYPRQCEKCQIEKPENKQDKNDIKIWVYLESERYWIFKDYKKNLPKISSKEHTTLEELITQAEEYFSQTQEQEKSTNKCSVCKAQIHSNSGFKKFSDYYHFTENTPRSEYRRLELATLLNKIPKCSCKPEKLLAVPRKGQNVFHDKLESDQILRKQYETARDKGTFDQKMNTSEHMQEFADFITAGQIATNAEPAMNCHIVPLQAGGCPLAFINTTNAPYNVVPLKYMCPCCQWLDALFTKWQGEPSQGKVWDLKFVDSYDVDKVQHNVDEFIKLNKNPQFII